MQAEELASALDAAFGPEGLGLVCVTGDEETKGRPDDQMRRIHWGRLHPAPKIFVQRWRRNEEGLTEATRVQPGLLRRGIQGKLLCPMWVCDWWGDCEDFQVLIRRLRLELLPLAQDLARLPEESKVIARVMGEEWVENVEITEQPSFAFSQNWGHEAPIQNMFAFLFQATREPIS